MLLFGNIISNLKDYAVARRQSISDVFYTGLNQLWRIISGPIMLILIPIYLTPELQGYWFTIIGLAVLLIFADLGFTSIIMQFAAHEFAYLRFGGNDVITGDDKHLRKLASLFIFMIRWALSVVAIMSPIIFFVGYFILSRKQSDIHWLLPWTIYLTGSMIAFVDNVILSFFEGCNLIGLGQRLRLIPSVIMTFLTVWGLIAGLNLYVLGYSLLTGAVISSAMILYSFRRMIMKLIAISRTSSYQWGSEFFPLLWRYAISWASGYFIFQAYTPLMFYFNGAVEAGKVGISLAMWAAIYNIASSWIISVTPRISIHVSRKEWKHVDLLLKRRLIFSLFTFLIGAAAFFLLFLLLNGRLPIFGRFVSLVSLLILGAAWFLQIIVNSIAVYLRAHKQEPLALPSFITALYITVLTYICVKYFNVDYFFMGFLSSYLWGLPWVISIYNRKKREIGR